MADEFDDEDWGGGGGGEDNNAAWGEGGEEFEEGGGEVQEAGEGGDDQELPLSVQLANSMYEAEENYKDNPAESLQGFRKVLELAEMSGDLDDELQSQVFKARKNIVLLMMKLEPNNVDAVCQNYSQFLATIPSVTRNEGSSAVEAILNYVGRVECPTNLAQAIYQATRGTLRQQKDAARLLYAVNMKLAHGYITRREFNAALDILDEVHAGCKLPNGEDDQEGKGSELLDIYAQHVRIAQLTDGRISRLSRDDLFERTKDLTLKGVNNPNSLSVIKESWGMMFGHDGAWGKAKTEFYGAFLNYQSAGLVNEAKKCLQYVVVASMLSADKDKKNIFDAPEAKAYAKDPEVSVISSLRAAYEKSDVNGFNTAMEAVNKQGDKFILANLESLVRDFQYKAIISLVKPYQRVRLDFVQNSLKVSAERVEDLLIALILDGELMGRLDQVNGLLDLSQNSDGGGRKYAAIDQWAGVLRQLCVNMPQPHAARSRGMVGMEPMFF